MTLSNHQSPTILQTDAIIARLGQEGRIISLSRGLALAMAEDQRGAPSLTYSALSQALSLPTWDGLRADIAEERDFQCLVWLLKGNGAASRYVISVAEVETPGADGAEVLVQGVDFSQVTELSRELEQQAYQDSLTGAYNRRYLNEVAPTIISQSKNVLVAVIDLQDFKGVNDTYGHDFGDRLLCHVADAITEAAPIGSLIVRLGGDEFVILVEGIAGADWTTRLSRDLETAIATPLACPDGAVSQRSNIGISVSPDDGHTIETLLANADRKMYHAKRAGVANIEIASSAFVDPSPRKDLVAEIVRGLDHHQFIPYYQPVYDVCSGRLIGAEALCRWQDGTGRVRKPIEFVPIASSHGLIERIDRANIQTVCGDLALWCEQGHCDLEVSVNLAATTLGDPSIVDFLVDTVTQNGLTPEKICLELTESLTLHENDPGWERISRLSELGFNLALDDFGTGYSSLALVRILPIKRLKIDCSFIHDILKNEKDRKIVASIIALSQALGTETVVEGVETWDQAKALSELGARLCQGYLFSEPIAATDFEAAFLSPAGRNLSGEPGRKDANGLANMAQELEFLLS